MRMSSELFWLVATTMLTAAMWIPYTLQLIVQMGPAAAVWDPQHETPLVARWAQRAKRAHANAVENLVVFAPLVLALHALDAGTAMTAGACAVFFVTRAAHYVVYVSAVPLARTVLFLVGFGCQLLLALTLVGSV